MASDALAPCITRSSATMALIMQDKWALFEGFQLLVPSQSEDVMESMDILSSL